MDQYSYTDDGGASLTARRHHDGERPVLSVRTNGTVYVDPLDLPEIMAGLCREAGREPPVMLGRPEVDHELGTTIGPLQVWERPDGMVGVGMLPGPATAVEPHVIRQFAAAAVAHADHADAGPDLAEVEALTTVLEDADCVTGDLAGLARAVLRAGYVREAKPDA
jgi:hypothetical protein